MSDLVLLVLLDAFRPDYLWRTEFLRDLARRSAIGSMEEPFGFVPRAAYFGGLSPNQAGYANMFARDGWRSPFPSIPALDRVARFGDRHALRNRSLEDAAARVPDFAARYVDGFNLGLGVLPSLAFTETQPPWGPRCPYRSLFHILDDHGRRWIQCAWPYTRVVADADAGIVGACLDQLTEDTRFAFVHLSALDAVGHQFGPGSSQLQHALGEINRACSVLFNAAHERFDRVRMLIFGDHGMVSVVRSVDVVAALADTGLAAGTDYDVFVDSPMVRFWFHHDDARAGIWRHLATLDAGRALTTADLARYEADRMPASNGHLFYVAHPGVVFAPNAFQPDGDVVRGMHGYLPDVADNRGGLLLYDSEVRQPRSLGVVAATQLFPTCLQLCGFDPAPHTARPPIAAQPATARWTVGGDPTCEARVEADLRRAKAMIAARAPDRPSSSPAVLVAARAVWSGPAIASRCSTTTTSWWWVQTRSTPSGSVRCWPVPSAPTSATSCRSRRSRRWRRPSSTSTSATAAASSPAIAGCSTACRRSLPATSRQQTPRAC